MLTYAKKVGYKIVGNRYVDPATGNDTQPDNAGIPTFLDDYTSLEISRPGLDAACKVKIFRLFRMHKKSH
jgi:hypothetical protein